MNRDPICALCTPPGRGALAVIRVSGSGAARIIRSLAPFFPKNPVPRRVYVGELKADNTALDQVVLTFFAPGKSFTGEETVEISCHGAPPIYREILKQLVLSGARPARRGEFSLRAFMNGKMDLTRAEGLHQLIESRNPRATRTAFYQMQGRFSRELEILETKWLDLLSRLEADIDFPLEGLPELDPQVLAGRLEELKTQVQNILSRYKSFESLQKGFSAGLFGPVNVGKSTLFNRLVEEDRSIVTREAGATRDIVEEFLPDSFLVLKDTAGFRGTFKAPVSSSAKDFPEAKYVGTFSGPVENPPENITEKPKITAGPDALLGKEEGGADGTVETEPPPAPLRPAENRLRITQGETALFGAAEDGADGTTENLSPALGEAERIGQQKSRELFRQADLRLLVLDGTAPFPPALQTLCPTFQRGLVVWTKKDLCPGVTKKALFSKAKGLHPVFFEKISLAETFFVSSVTGEGLDDLKAKLKSLSEEVGGGEVLVSNLRHFKGLKTMDRALKETLSLLNGAGERDLMALELREGLSALHEITGKRLDDRVLDNIFKQFCIGK